MALVTVSSVSAQEKSDSVARDSVKPKAWLAAIETVGVTGLIVGYNNSILSSSPFSKVTFESMMCNAKEFKWWWDEDYMYTNTIEHPYHGAIYYLAARENGQNIAQSALFSVGGSLLWEFFGEAERPAYNDMLTTPIGGVTIGEPLHRISRAIIDNSASGLERVGRELLATIVNPMCGLNRLLHGDSWRVRGNRREHHMLSSTLSAGFRHLTVRNQPNVSTYYLNWNTTYGDVMGAEGDGLFDYFDLQMTAAVGNHQTPLNFTRVTSQLWRIGSKQCHIMEQTWGLYNHFYYIYAEPEYATGDERKFRHCVGYSEVGAVGPGFIYRVQLPHIRWEQQFFLNAILIGATPMKLLDRQHPQIGYSWGSGYGAKVNTRLHASHLLRLSLDIDCSQLFTWVGYRCRNVQDLMLVKAQNIQGERGNAQTIIVTPSLDFWPFRHIGLEVRGRYICHKFNYLYHQHATSISGELLAGLLVRL